MRTPQTRNNGIRRNTAAGQNLIELALTLPFVILILFFMVELSRAWFVFEAAKMAAVDGAQTAAMNHNPTAGLQQLDKRLADAHLTVKARTVTQVAGRHAYEAAVTVVFEPVFGGLTVQTLSGPMEIIPEAYDVTYTDIKTASVF
ncbi:MAG: TadE family protein [Candidatus Melainabacteria bacterium]